MSRESPTKLIGSALQIFLCAAVSLAQQTPAKPADSGIIEGHVLRADNGEPISGAKVNLRSVRDNKQSFQTLTDSQGRFVLQDIPSGTYRFWVSRTGYVQQGYAGQNSEGEEGFLKVDPHQKLRELVFHLERTAVITGRIYDQNGDPLEGVEVRGLQYGFWDRKRQLYAAAGAQTNDLGEYRLYGLVPGEYIVSATHRNFERLGTSRKDSEAGADEGYLPIYYPGTLDPRQAVAVHVHPGEQLERLDITLFPTVVVSISGQVVNATTGEPVYEANVDLVSSQPRLEREGNVTYSSGKRGTFEIGNVTPGSYTLTAHAIDPEKREVYLGRKAIVVGRENVRGVRVEVAPGFQLKGHIQTSGPGMLDVSETQVQLRSPLGWEFGGVFANAKSDGTFLLQDVAPGPYFLFVPGPLGDFYLRTARLGSEEILEAGLNLVTGGSYGTLELVLSPTGGRVQGIVLTAEQLPARRATVVLIPEGSHRDRVEFYASTITDENGQFSFRGISPDEYKLFAWKGIDGRAYEDPEFVKKYQDKGKPLRVEESGRHTIDLKLIPLDKASATPASAP